MRFSRIGCLLVILMLLIMGCAAGLETRIIKPVEKPVEEPQSPLVLIPPEELPPLLDDLNWKSIDDVIAKGIRYYEGAKEHTTYHIGENRFSALEMRESLVTLKEILDGPGTDDEKNGKIKEAFNVYRTSGYDGKGTVLFTGYFEPIMNGSLAESEEYCHPIYKTPNDVVVVNLGKFLQQYRNKRIIGRVEKGELVPYSTRAEIDVSGSLQNKQLELVWVNDPVALFFLHIQGSGKIKLTDGRFMQISYAQSNGRPYRSIGRYLRDNGKLSETEITHELVKKYLREHPDERSDILNHNESYVFFRMVKEGPVGALGVQLTAERSIATDLDLYPRGAIAFIRLKKPVFDDSGIIKRWETFSRFVLNQDTGGVIKGPGRVDLFCGTGADAEAFAGSLKERGELYFFVKKKDEK
jgi:membrane-bound lytic murein transglycosylase A